MRASCRGGGRGGAKPGGGVTECRLGLLPAHRGAPGRRTVGLGRGRCQEEQGREATPSDPHGVPHCPPLLAAYPGAAPNATVAKVPHTLPSFSSAALSLFLPCIPPSCPNACLPRRPSAPQDRLCPSSHMQPLVRTPAQPPCTHPNPDDSLTSVAQQGLLLEDRSLLCSLLTSRNQIWGQGAHKWGF